MITVNRWVYKHTNTVILLTYSMRSSHKQKGNKNPICFLLSPLSNKKSSSHVFLSYFINIGGTWDKTSRYLESHHSILFTFDFLRKIAYKYWSSLIRYFWFSYLKYSQMKICIKKDLLPNSNGYDISIII